MTHSTDKPSCCSINRQQVFMTTQTRTSESGVGVKPQDSAKVDESMVYLAGGQFLMGTDDGEGFPADGEGPIRMVTIDPFYIDTCAVTNEQFYAFVEVTGYKTEAETFTDAGFIFASS